MCFIHIFRSHSERGGFFVSVCRRINGALSCAAALIIVVNIIKVLRLPRKKYKKIWRLQYFYYINCNKYHAVDPRLLRIQTVKAD